MMKINEEEKINEKFSISKNSKNKNFNFSLDVNNFYDNCGDIKKNYENDQIKETSVEKSNKNKKINEFKKNKNNLKLDIEVSLNPNFSIIKEENNHSNLPLKKEDILYANNILAEKESLKDGKIYDFPLSKEKKEKPDCLLWKSEENFFRNEKKKKNFDIIDNSNSDSILIKEDNNQKSKTFGKKKIGKSFNLGIDTEAINELYLFGGDKHEIKLTDDQKQINFEEKIKLLAKHCVEYMQKNKEKEDCEFFQSDVLFRDNDYNINEIEESLCKHNNDKKLKEKDIVGNIENFNTLENSKFFNKINSDKISERELNLNISDQISIKKKNNSFSNPPLPTSKNKESKNFCFGQKIEKMGIFNKSIEIQANINHENSLDSKYSSGLTIISNKENESLSLPKNRKNFLRNKKTKNCINKKLF